MIGNLTEDQLQFVLEGTRYQSKTVDLFRQHYVARKTKKEAADELGMTSTWAYKKFTEFEQLVEDVAKEQGLNWTLVMHKPSDAKAIIQYDITRQKPTNKT